MSELNPEHTSMSELNPEIQERLHKAETENEVREGVDYGQGFIERLMYVVKCLKVIYVAKNYPF